ncbi:quinone oxidoreductase family protein [Nocardia sp. JW2]|uniref:quinone oxidoreductase family protein n=1 Tax=Nocardia sp. JW2 TaxID=3450738 RepID=UPI003F43F2DA
MTTTGAPEVLVVEEVDTPRPAAGEVLVRIEAVPVLYPETLLRSGAFPFPAQLPAVFGFQAAGTVVEVGADADPGLVDARVVVSTPGYGSYAEYVAVSADSVTVVPAGLELDAAAAILMAGSVATALFDTAAPSAGETVLVEAAATGVGASLTRLCAAAGLRVIATAGGPAKAELARANGAHEVVDHNAPDWVRQLPALLGDDTLGVVFDSIGGDSLTPVLDFVTPLRGRILSYGWLAGAPAQVTAAELILRGLTLTGCAGPAWSGTVAAHGAAALDAAAQGRLVPVVDAVLPMADAAKAHRMLEDRVAMGSVLLRP